MLKNFSRNLRMIVTIALFTGKSFEPSHVFVGKARSLH
jgi:hypothetical protein